MKVCFETFGCRLNKAEALQMEADYLAKGWELTSKHSDADLFVVRGCSVTARAQYECEKLIAHLRRHYPTVPLHTCGCLKKSTPNLPDLPNIPNLPNLPTRTARAYLKVQDGCSGKCTFCIVPKFRGTSTSVPFADVLDTAKRFIDLGYHEIVVTGCNLSLYASAGKRLPELLSSLANLSSDCRIRLGSLEPGSCAPETIHAFSEHSNICRFLHIPVQSGSNRILMTMGRPYSVKDIDTLVACALKLLPKLGLGCDLMTGFPGEHNLDFLATKGLLKRLPFNNAHIFPYSERPGTVAAHFSDVVPKDLRSQRAHSLAHDAKAMRQIFAKSFLGKDVEVVVEDEKRIIGWTSEYLKCEATGNAPRKSLVRIRVTSVKNDRLFGRLVSHPIRA